MASAGPAIGTPPTTTPTPAPPPSPSAFRVLFCGPDMAHGAAATAAALAADAPSIQVVRAASRAEGVALLPSADLAVPLMTVLPGPAIAAAAAGAGGRLRTILQYGAGLEGVDVGAAVASGVAVRNIPSAATANAGACAEMGLLLALGLLRRLPECAASVAGRVVGDPPGRTLAGKRALVIGFGGIAHQLIPRLAALGVRVECVRRSAWAGDGDDGGGGARPSSPSPHVQACHGPDEDDDDPASVAARRSADAATARAALAWTGRWGDLPGAAGRADLVFLAVPQTPSTAGLVGPAFWGAVKPGVVLINVCRGGLVCPDAALAALEAGTAGGLGLDVTWEEPVPPTHPLLSHPRVLVTPHVGGVTEESYAQMAAIVARVARAERRRKEEEGKR